MTKPENCSAGGYCDCYQILEKLGYWDEDKTFLGLSLNDAQLAEITRLLKNSPEDTAIELALAAAASAVADAFESD